MLYLMITVIVLLWYIHEMGGIYGLMYGKDGKNDPRFRDRAEERDSGIEEDWGNLKDSSVEEKEDNEYGYGDYKEDKEPEEVTKDYNTYSDRSYGEEVKNRPQYEDFISEITEDNTEGDLTEDNKEDENKKALDELKENMEKESEVNGNSNIQARNRQRKGRRFESVIDETKEEGNEEETKHIKEDEESIESIEDDKNSDYDDRDDYDIIEASEPLEVSKGYKEDGVEDKEESEKDNEEIKEYDSYEEDTDSYEEIKLKMPDK